MSRKFRGTLLTVIVTALAIMGFNAAGSIAQQDAASGPWRSDDPNIAVVQVDGFEYDIPKDVAVVGYVIKRDQFMTGSTVRMRLFVRDSSGEYLPMPWFETAATGNLANARIGDAYVLVPAEGQEQP